MILVAYGANLPSLIGSPARTYGQLPDILSDYGVHVVRASSLFITAPVPAIDQPDYANGVLLVETKLDAKSLLLTLLRVESDLGRVRGEVNAARGIDLDLIAYGDLIFDGGELVLPHPRMHERLFVLEPLAEIVSNWVHPVFQKTVFELIKAI
jgi:2-amino-4-hydroxy-6-hydroxymethyldihydropteridine diphosphokinase